MTQPIFLIALPKSYTTVFGGILGQHPMVETVPELNLFIGDKVIDWANQQAPHVFCDGLLRTVAQMLFGDQTAATVEQALDWLRERSDWPVEKVFDTLRDIAAPAAILDQSPLYSKQPSFLMRIMKTYPEARFIHLVRNPTSWVKSVENWGNAGNMVFNMYTSAERGLNHAPDPLDIWHAAHTGIDSILGQLPKEQVITLTGEDTVTRPKEMMSQVLDWLGYDYDDGTLTDMMHPERSVYACWGPPGARGGNNPDFLTDARLRLRDDREKLMKMDRDRFTLSDELAEYAGGYGYY